MIMYVYSVRDDVAGEFGPLFMAKNTAVASRNFMQVLKTAEYPSDFSLHLIGEFSTETGVIVTDSCPMKVTLTNVEEMPEVVK